MHFQFTSPASPHRLTGSKPKCQAPFMIMLVLLFFLEQREENEVFLVPMFLRQVENQECHLLQESIFLYQAHLIHLPGPLCNVTLWLA